jgi:hypothetical protein
MRISKVIGEQAVECKEFHEELINFFNESDFHQDLKINVISKFIVNFFSNYTKEEFLEIFDMIYEFEAHSRHVIEILEKEYSDEMKKYAENLRQKIKDQENFSG